MSGDDDLLQELRAEAAAADPVPADAVMAARSALAYLRLDAELAELTFDSDERDLARVRNAVSDVRLLTFESEAVVIEVEVAADGRFQGLVHEAEPERIWLVSRRGERELSVDDHGRFALDDTPVGPVRLRLDLGHQLVETAWLTLRT